MQEIIIITMHLLLLLQCYYDTVLSLSNRISSHTTTTLHLPECTYASDFIERVIVVHSIVHKLLFLIWWPVISNVSFRLD